MYVKNICPRKSVWRVCGKVCAAWKICTAHIELKVSNELSNNSQPFKHLSLRYVTAAKGIRIGRGRDVFMGALVSKEHKEKVQRYVDYAIEDGGQILCGETVNVPLLEDEEGPDKEENGRMSGGNILMFS